MEVHSVGLSDYHVGEDADPRSRETALRHGIDISGHRARQFRVSDFDAFDRIYVMDPENYEGVMGMARNKADEDKVDYLLNLSSPGHDLPVPDPYYGGKDGFENVFHLLDEASDRLVEDLEAVLKDKNNSTDTP